MSRRRLAGLAGIHRESLARIERGETSPNAATLARLAVALGVPVDALLGPAGAIFVAEDDDGPARQGEAVQVGRDGPTDAE